MFVSSEAESKDSFCSSEWAMFSCLFCISSENWAFEIYQLSRLADKTVIDSGYVSYLTLLNPIHGAAFTCFMFPAVPSLFLLGTFALLACSLPSVISVSEFFFNVRGHNHCLLSSSETQIS